MIQALNQNERCRLAQQYKFLGQLPNLSNSDEIWLSLILEIAQSDEVLSNMLEEIDLELGHELGTLSENSDQYNEQFRDKLRAQLIVIQHRN